MFCQGCAKMTSRIGGSVGGGNWKYAHGTAHYGRNFSVKWLKVCVFFSMVPTYVRHFLQFSLLFHLPQKFLCCEWWQKPWSWQGCCSPYQMPHEFFNFIVFLFSSQFEFQKFGMHMLEELHSVFRFFLEIHVTDQCTCSVKCNYIL